MDLNYLYFRRQVSQYNADNAAGDAARSAHQVMADAYAVLIDDERNGRGPELLAPVTIDGVAGGDAAALLRVRVALERQSAHWLQRGRAASPPRGAA